MVLALNPYTSQQRWVALHYFQSRTEVVCRLDALLSPRLVGTFMLRLASLTLGVLVQFVGLVTSGEIGMHSITEVLPSVADRFAPLFLHDHVVAL